MPAPTKVTLANGNFQDNEGNPLALGYLSFVLSSDESISGVGQIVSGITTKITLDANGNVNPGQQIWGNDQMLPINSYYRVTGYTAAGQPAWGPNNQQVNGNGTTFDLNTWTPNQVLSWTPSTSSPLLQTNGSRNSRQDLLNLTGGGATTVAEAGGTVTITTPAPPAGVTLKTNGTNNSTQTLLNLTGTGGASLSESAGTVSIFAPAVSVPGSSDFADDWRIRAISGTNSPTWELIGPHTWAQNGLANAAGGGYSQIDSTSQPQCTRLTTGAGVGVQCYQFYDIGGSGINPFINYTGRVRFRMRLVQTTNSVFYLGIVSTAGGGQMWQDNPNVNFAGFAYSSRRGDTTFQAYTCTSNTNFTLANTGIAVDTNVHVFDMFYTPTSCKFYIDNALVATITTTIPATTTNGGWFTGLANVSGGNVSYDYWSVRGQLPNTLK